MTKHAASGVPGEQNSEHMMEIQCFQPSEIQKPDFPSSQPDEKHAPLFNIICMPDV